MSPWWWLAALAVAGAGGAVLRWAAGAGMRHKAAIDAETEAVRAARQALRAGPAREHDGPPR